MRECVFEDGLGGTLTVQVENDKDCIFCNNCCVFWDFSNGPYMFICDKGRDAVNNIKSDERSCELFEEE